MSARKPASPTLFMRRSSSSSRPLGICSMRLARQTVSSDEMPTLTQLSRPAFLKRLGVRPAFRVSADALRCWARSARAALRSMGMAESDLQQHRESPTAVDGQSGLPTRGSIASKISSGKSRKVGQASSGTTLVCMMATPGRDRFSQLEVDQELIIAQTNSNPKSELVSEVGTHREAATFLKKRGCAVQELAFTSRKQEGREQAGGCLLSASLIDDGFFAYSDIHTRCSPPTASLAVCPSTSQTK